MVQQCSAETFGFPVTPSHFAGGEGFRLGDDLELLQLYRFQGGLSIGIGQVRSGFYGCGVG